MNPDFTFALYVFCMHWHSGQSSRLYRILSRLSGRVRVSDRAINVIRCAQPDPAGEWYEARRYYRELKAKYKGDKR